ncbi:hypothetical protein Dsin_022590 [Dipteronia sinensis]|uniref:Ubiquitin-like protease family profile domain-containing protein n=1 Tax=Dipteronia sinensis TaxID=43782 RepID=A0AAE0A282_9ROSI|nr:hypothetical protein Dsin_022590 [Dipteronia sinensis]
MPSDAVGKAPKDWSVLKYKWSPEDLKTVRGSLPSGNRPWHEVDVHWLVASVDLTFGKIHMLDPFRQEVPVQIRKEQVAPLRWFLPSMLHQVGFHEARPRDDPKFHKQNKPFGVSMVSSTHVPQQSTWGNCGAHTLRLIEYVLTNRQPFHWSEDDMGTIREKMAVEVFCNSRPQ